MIKKLVLFVLVSGFLFANSVVNVDLLWKHQFEFAGYYMAKEKGFYKDAGLEVNLKEYSPSKDIVDDVLNQRADFAIGYSKIIKDIANGKELLLLHTTFQVSPMVLISKDNIKSFSDFQNKRVMIEDSALQTASLLAMLRAYGVDIDKIKKVPITFNVKDLIKNRCDLMEGYLSNEVFTLKKYGIKYRVWDPKDYGFNFYDNILFTSQKLYKKNPELVKKFNKATIMGWNYAFAHLDETIEVILRKYNTQHKSKEALLYEAKILKELAYYKEGRFGKIDKHRLERTLDIYRLLNFRAKNVDWDRYVLPWDIDEKFELTKVQKEWIKNHIITVGVSKWNPIIFKRNDEISGIAGDIVKLVFEKVGLKYRSVSDNWDVLMNNFKRHNIEILPTTYYTKQRATFGLYTDSYFNLKEDIFVKDSNDKIKSFQDLNGKKLAIVKKYGTIEKIKKRFPKIKIIQTENLSESVRLVLNGKVDALYEVKVVVQNYLSRNFISSLKSLNQDVFPSSGLHFFVDKQKPILRDILQKGLKQVTDIEKERIILKWIGKNRVLEKQEFKLTKKEREYLKDKTIKLCVKENFMPLEDFRDGKLDGLAKDYTKLFKSLTGANFEVVAAKRKRDLKRNIEKNLCDLIWVVSKSKMIEKKFNIVGKRNKIPIVVVSKDKEEYINSLDSLENKVVAVIEGSYVDNVLSQYGHSNIKRVKNIQDGLEMVDSGNAQLFLSNLMLAIYNLKKSYKDRLFISGRIEGIDASVFSAVNKNDFILTRIVEKFLNSIDERTLREMELKWKNVSFEKRIDYSYLWKVVIVVFLIFLFFYVRQMQLKKHNRLLENLNNKLKLQEELYALTFENSAFGILLIDLQTNKIVDCNSQVVHMLRAKSKQDVLDLHPAKLSPPKQPDGNYSFEKADRMIDIAIEKGRHIFQWKHIRFDKEEFWTEVILTKIEIDGKEMLHVSLKDIDKEVELKKELEELNRTLQSRIDKAIEENTKKEKLLQQQSRLAQMGEMISMIAHQWRQPLSAINSAIIGIDTKLHIGKFDLDTKDGVEECLSFINKKHNNVKEYVKSLSQTIDDFRNFFKPDKQKEVVSIVEPIQKALKIVTTSMSSKGITINTNFNTTKELSLFSNELMQVILNILKNAEDNFVEKKIENPAIDIVTREVNGKYVTIEISDNGGGIPKNILPNIFDPYYSTKNEKNGTGLGLYMSKIIVEEHHNGKIEAFNQNGGVCFKIELK